MLSHTRSKRAGDTAHSPWLRFVLSSRDVVEPAPQTVVSGLEHTKTEPTVCFTSHLPCSSPVPRPVPFCCSVTRQRRVRPPDSPSRLRVRRPGMNGPIVPNDSRPSRSSPPDFEQRTQQDSQGALEPPPGVCAKPCVQTRQVDAAGCVQRPSRLRLKPPVAPACL